jgi:hypothetical protein
VTVAFTLALTVASSVDTPEDVLVRGNAEQSVAELARRLAGYLGRPAMDAAGQPLGYGLRVERTGEQLRPDAPLSSVDLLEGDLVTLLVPRGAERRRPRWAEDADAEPSSPTVIPLRRRMPIG